MRGCIEAYYDDGIFLPDGISRETLESSEGERINRFLAIITVTGSVPRRLGGEATDQELSLDKKRSRRVCHVLRQTLLYWEQESEEIEPNEDMRREGIQLEWLSFASDYVLKLDTSRRRIATWAIQNDEEAWGAAAIRRLEAELHWMEHALRD